MTSTKLLPMLFTRFIFLLLAFSSLDAVAQKIISGRLVNTTTKEAIPYANIGIRNDIAGTISNADGSFSLTIPVTRARDTLVFSSLGYIEKAIPVKWFDQRKEIIVYLNQKIISLKPVVLQSKKEKNRTYELGNKDMSGGVLETDTTYAGRALALLIENEYADKGFRFPAYLERARLKILRNNLPSFRVRVRINEVDGKTGKPGRDLLEQSIILESRMRKGWLQFDLSKLDIEVNGPFFLVFEQLLDLADRTSVADGYRDYIREHPKRIVIDSVDFEGKKVERQVLRGGIDLPGTFIAIATSRSANEKYTCYTRNTSLGEWAKVRGIITATVTVSQSPDTAPETNVETPCTGDQANCTADKICKEFMEESNVNGMQIMVSKGGKLRWSANLGNADLEKSIRVTNDTRFRINSISKSMTSLALIKLVAEGKLDLDATVQQYIPGFPVKAYPVTIRQLAGHLAGFRDYDESNLDDYIRTEHFTSATDAMRIFKDDTLLFSPGSSFYYSVFGWNLLGAVIEAVSDETYLEYMTKHIFQPLKLFSTGGDVTGTVIPNRSKFYDATGEANDLGDLSYKYPAGGLLSTTNDLVAVGNELLHGTYFDPNLKQLLFKTQHTTDGKPTGYGLGWYTGKDRNGHRIWYHAGDSFSGSSFLAIYPDDDMVIAFLANSQEGVTFDLQKLGELFY